MIGIVYLTCPDCVKTDCKTLTCKKKGVIKADCSNCEHYPKR